MRSCLSCGTDIEDRHFKSKRCETCQKQHNRDESNRIHNERKPTKPCMHCKKPHKQVRQHCSESCRQAGAAKYAVKGEQRKRCGLQECSKDFVTSRHRVYCSIACQRLSRRAREKSFSVTCWTCEMPFEIKGIGKKPSQTRYCGAKCRRVAASMRMYGIVGNKHQIRCFLDFEHCMSCGTQFDNKSKMLEQSMDHDHLSGWFRGVICGRCNIAAGYQPQPAYLRKLADYLERTTPVFEIRIPT